MIKDIENNKGNREMGKILETERLILREFEDSDVEALKSVLGDEKVMEFSLNGAMDEIQIKEFIVKSKARYENDKTGVWAAELKSSGKLVGGIGLPFQEVEGKRYMEVAYRLATKFWGQGLASEAAKACRDYAFNNLKSNYLISIIEESNTLSIAVATRIGMKFERNAIAWDIPVKIYSIRNENKQ